MNKSVDKRSPMTLPANVSLSSTFASILFTEPSGCYAS